MDAGDRALQEQLPRRFKKPVFMMGFFLRRGKFIGQIAVSRLEQSSLYASVFESLSFRQGLLNTRTYGCVSL
jgi:hypothetical protein